jgi:hypothetical protein
MHRNVGNTILKGTVYVEDCLKESLVIISKPQRVTCQTINYLPQMQ